jgi:hypothetical protein
LQTTPDSVNKAKPTRGEGDQREKRGAGVGKDDAPGTMDRIGLLGGVSDKSL